MEHYCLIKIIHLGQYPYQQQNLKILLILHQHKNLGTRCIITNMKLIPWGLGKRMSLKIRYRHVWQFLKFFNCLYSILLQLSPFAASRVQFKGLIKGSHFRVQFNDAWFVFHDSSWSFFGPYFSRKHIFYESYRVSSRVRMNVLHFAIRDALKITWT